MQSTTIAVDLEKSVFEVAVSHREGQVAERHRLSRGQFSCFLSARAPATIVMEACGTAHFWGREAGARDHRVMLLPPHAVRPYVLRNKTDGADAKGLLEAARNDAIQPVPMKSVDQHVLASLHRMRSAWLATCTARLNTMRGPLRELGYAIPLGARQAVPHVWALVSDADSGLPDSLRAVLAEAAREVGDLETRLREVEHSLETMSRESETLTRVRTISGVGLLTATALLAFVGDVQRFPSSRHFASYLGPDAAGVIERPAAATRGDQQARRSLLAHAADPRCPLRPAARQEEERRGARPPTHLGARSRRARGHNKAAVALANKLARIVWAVWRREQGFAEPRTRSGGCFTHQAAAASTGPDGASVLTGAGRRR